MRPPIPEFMSGRTNPNAATIGYTIGTASPSTGVGRLGRRLPCRMCSTRAHKCRTICLPCAATSRIAGTGYEGRMCPGLAQYLGQELWWACPLQKASFLLNSRYLGKAAAVLPDNPHFLAAKTSVLDCHAEKRVLVVLIVCGKRILVKQY